MATIDKNSPPTDADVAHFLSKVKFHLPPGFIEFYKQANGGNIDTDEAYIILWPLTELVQLNKDYHVDQYAPEFFIFGSDGADTAYAIEKETGCIFEMPFIGMSKEEALFKSENFAEFIKFL